MINGENAIPSNLAELHGGEEQLRIEALRIVARNPQLQLHLAIVEAAMDRSDTFRQFDTSDEDLKVAQVLGMRTFNALGASLKLALSGYHQNSALILRDVLETVFLLSLFAGDRTSIARWRLADKKARMNEFRPVKVREKLDARDGFTSNRRAEMYELFSELAGHPTMKSAWMLRPQKDADAIIGPFMEVQVLEAVISEMGRLAVQIGDEINAFLHPLDWAIGLPSRLAFAQKKEVWLSTFYPAARRHAEVSRVRVGFRNEELSAHDVGQVLRTDELAADCDEDGPLSELRDPEVGRADDLRSSDVAERLEACAELLPAPARGLDTHAPPPG